ncbi:MAG TPA: hypothetical protein VN628_07710 [Vicinamibacterales bacterium]|nr:hypothetical protein [Vicinamibacterales bacterium]
MTEGASVEREEAARAFREALHTLETALTKIDAALSAAPSGDIAAHLSALEQHAQAAAPLSPRQRSFNAALVAELRQQRVFQAAVIELIRCQASLIAFLRTVRPYVDTRDFTDIVRAISDDDLKRSDALLARDRKRELQLDDIQTELAAIRARLEELQRA